MTGPPNVSETPTRLSGPAIEPVIGATELTTEQLLADPFLSPQVITSRMYRDLVTGVAKSHLPEATPLKFPEVCNNLLDIIVFYFLAIIIFRDDPKDNSLH